jgi:hypothetical protein
VHPDGKAAALAQLNSSAWLKAPPKQGTYPAGPLQEPTSELKYTEELNGLEKLIMLVPVTITGLVE